MCCVERIEKEMNMLNLFTPALAGMFSALLRSRGDIASISGASEDVVNRVLTAAEQHIGKDERLQAQLFAEMESARQHDVKTFDGKDRATNALRSSVRPLITFVAMGWYVYARLNAIPLMPEDYAIIGGILAFWFGFRPFEKMRSS